MFTGIIEEIGLIKQVCNGAHSAILQIQAEKVRHGLKIGDSVAVNGVCLTVTTLFSQGFCADVMHETLNRSSLSLLRSGSPVNLERAMPANGRFDGHIVAGHVDDVGKIIDIKRDDNAIWYTIEAASPVMRYIVEKGSIAIDGISLTVAGLTPDTFRVSVIPHTAQVTTLGMRHIGDTVNLENDIIGKYIERFVNSAARPKSTLTRDWLLQHGY